MRFFHVLEGALFLSAAALLAPSGARAQAGCPIGFTGTGCSTCAGGYTGAGCAPDPAAAPLTFASLATKTRVSDKLTFAHSIVDTDTVQLGLRVDAATGYVALGAVADGSFAMTDGRGVVLGWREDGATADTIGEYDITGYSASAFANAAPASKGRAYFERDTAAGTIAIIYERKAAAIGTTAALKLAGGATRFIYASAPQNRIAQHNGINGFFSVDLSLKCANDCSIPAGNCGAGNICTCNTGYNGTDCSVCATGFERDTTAGAPCVSASTDPTATTAKATFDALGAAAGAGSASAAGGDWVLRWTVDAAAGTASFAVRAKTQGWVAVGFGTSSMVSKDTVIGAVLSDGTARVRSYEVSSRSSGAIKEDATQTISDPLAEADGDYTVVAFTRKLDTGIAGKPVLSSSADTAFVWATASSDSLTTKHATATRGSGSLNLGSGGSSVSSDDTQAKIIAHGALMFIAWWVCIGIGYVSAAYFRHKGPIWFKTHQAMQLIGVTVACIAFFISLSMVSTHFRIAHTWFGLIAMILGLMQPINAAFRPAPDAGQKRFIFNLIHIITGSLAIIFAWIATGLGLRTAEASTAIMGAFYAYVALFAIVVLYGEFKLRPLRKHKESHQPETNVVIGSS
jgi:hypothetical protein